MNSNFSYEHNKKQKAGQNPAEKNPENSVMLTRMIEKSVKIDLVSTVIRIF